MFTDSVPPHCMRSRLKISFMVPVGEILVSSKLHLSSCEAQVAPRELDMCHLPYTKEKDHFYQEVSPLVFSYTDIKDCI